MEILEADDREDLSWTDLMGGNGRQPKRQDREKSPD